MVKPICTIGTRTTTDTPIWTTDLSWPSLEEISLRNDTRANRQLSSSSEGASSSSKRNGKRFDKDRSRLTASLPYSARSRRLRNQSRHARHQPLYKILSDRRA